MIHQKGSRFVKNDLYDAQLISESSELVPDRSFFYFIIAADLFLLFFHWKKKKKSEGDNTVANEKEWQILIFWHLPH